MITRACFVRIEICDGAGYTLPCLGGLDVRACEKPRQLSATARNTEAAGLLTRFASVLVETGSRMDDVNAKPRPPSAKRHRVHECALPGAAVQAFAVEPANREDGNEGRSAHHARGRPLLPNRQSHARSHRRATAHRKTTQRDMALGALENNPECHVMCSSSSAWRLRSSSISFERRGARAAMARTLRLVDADLAVPSARIAVDRRGSRRTNFAQERRTSESRPDRVRFVAHVRAEVFSVCDQVAPV